MTAPTPCRYGSGWWRRPATWPSPTAGGAARRQQRLARLPVCEPSLPPSAETLDARRAWSVVSAFLDRIPPAQREVFVLCQVQGLPASEVAHVLGCSPNTVGSRLRLAR
ncbi:MAG: RNA polymerase sigma factor, partial [Deltaproteobacteria bacterium]|nr:RNA polymerase sigma factor [Deltaproteobacteria bacterium]